MRLPSPIDGRHRRFILHLPSRPSDAPMPLVVVFHGAFSNPKRAARLSGFSALADREGFAVMYPYGIGLLGFLRHWNGYHCCAKAARDRVDDVGFAAGAIRTAAGRAPIDRDRVYAVGFSNGGMIAAYLAARRPDDVRAVALLSTAVGSKPANQPEKRIPDLKKPVPAVIFHGDRDSRMAYDGGQNNGPPKDVAFYSVRESVDYWRRNNRCSGPPQVDTLHGGAVIRETWDQCPGGSPVQLYTLKGWGHQWAAPAATDRLPPEDPLRGFDAAPIIWGFFKRFK
jgi:polyhydroxybutyrate depolymerase